MKLGDRIILWDEDKKFFLVTIKEIKESKGTWTGNMYEGFRAEDSKGNNYYCQYECFDDISMDPYNFWHSDKYGCLYEITHRATRKPLPDIEIFKEHYKDIIDYCEKHDIVFYKENKTGCFGCYMEKTYNKEYCRVGKYKGTFLLTEEEIKKLVKIEFND